MDRKIKVGHRDARLRSRGCFSCIRMKVKCDGAKPHCQRCIKARRSCPGYRQTVTTFAVETAPRSRTFTFSASPAVVTPMTDWTTSAINHYVYHFVVPSFDGIPGLHNHIPMMYSLYPDKGYLRSAVKAVAMANFARANRMNRTQFLEAQNWYGEAIHGLRIALNDATEISSAAALMATEVLSQYDLIVGSSDGPSASPHRYGMMNILRRQLLDGKSESVAVTKGVFTNLLLQNIGPSIGISAPAPPWDMFPPRDDAPDMACLFLGLVAQTVTLCRGDGAGFDSIHELLHLERGFGEWETQVPDSWKYTVHPVVRTQAQGPCFPSATITFNGVNAMLLWILFWMAQLDVRQTLDKVLPLDSSNRVGVCARMFEVVDTICAAVSSMTRASQTEAQGRGGATQVISCVFAMRSLSIVSQTPGLPRHKADWVVRQLEQLGHEAGLGQAFVWAAQLRTSLGEASQRGER